jgi:hypothetical protein
MRPILFLNLQDTIEQGKYWPSTSETHMLLGLFLGIPVETVPGLGYIEAGGARMVLGWGVDTIMAIWVGHRGLVAGGWGRKCDHFVID